MGECYSINMYGDNYSCAQFKLITNETLNYLLYIATSVVVSNVTVHVI